MEQSIKLTQMLLDMPWLPALVDALAKAAKHVHVGPQGGILVTIGALQMDLELLRAIGQFQLEYQNWLKAKDETKIHVPGQEGHD